MSPGADYSIERLADRAEIADILHRWCRAIDRLDYDAMRAVFHPGAYDAHGGDNGDVEGLIDWIRARHRMVETSVHALSNILIDFVERDAAIVESRVQTLQRARPAEPVDANGVPPAVETVSAFVRYVDRFERRDARWRIVERTVVYEARHLIDAPEGRWPEQAVTSRRDGEDFLLKMLARDGLR